MADDDSLTRVAQSDLRARWTFVGLLALTIVSAAVAALVGEGDLSDATLRPVLLQLRAGRLGAALLSGAALAVAGVLVQGLFHNPLASPSILGTTAGASLGGRLVLLLGFSLATGDASPLVPPDALLPLGCVAGALAALALLLVVASKSNDGIVLLLSGFLLSSLFTSLAGFVTSLAQDRWELGRAIIGFALGDVSGAGLPQVAFATPMVLVGIAYAWSWSRPLDVMLSGDDEARSLGVEVLVLRRWVVVWTAILTASAVALSGNVGFVGLVVPHALRPLLGVSHRRLVPGAALAGGSFVVLCDVCCRILPGQSELPLGVVTGLIGAPTFLWLLIRHRGAAPGV